MQRFPPLTRRRPLQRRRRSWFLLVAIVGALGAGAQSPASAAPQVNVGITPGLNWRPGAKLAFDGSISADVLFGRSSDLSYGIGPRVEIGTRAFDDLRTAAGLTTLIPLDPLVASLTLHGLLQTNAGRSEPGVGGRLFFGVRPYNYYGWYSAGLGLTFGVDQVLVTDTTNVTLGLQLDGMWLSLPLLFLYDALLN
jgi:hypothetical protein